MVEELNRNGRDLFRSYALATRREFRIAEPQDWQFGLSPIVARARLRERSIKKFIM